MSSQPKLVLFDVGGVLVHFYHIRDQVAARLGVDPEALGELFKEYDVARADGSMTEVEVEEKIRERFNLTQPPGFWSNLEWVNDFRPIPEMHQLVNDLVGHYRVGILSNVGKDVYEKGWSISGLWPKVKFDPMVFSYQVKLAKPDPRIYEVATAQAGLAPEEILFIDDMPKNLEVAQKVGLQTFQFNPAEAAADAARLRKLLLGNDIS